MNEWLSQVDPQEVIDLLKGIVFAIFMLMVLKMRIKKL